MREFYSVHVKRSDIVVRGYRQNLGFSMHITHVNLCKCLCSRDIGRSGSDNCMLSRRNEKESTGQRPKEQKMQDNNSKRRTASDQSEKCEDARKIE